MELLGDVGLVESRFGPFGYCVMSVQDMCTVCAKRPIGSKIILDAANGAPRWRVSSGSLLKSVWR